jgi:lincosamide nucleotidyltransferase A/C/D/E
LRAKEPATGWNRKPKAPMRAEDVLVLLDLLDARGIAVWLDGGWGVDALLEEQTREHDDLDLVSSAPQLPELEAALARTGYAYAEGPPTNPVYRDAAGRQVDVHPVVFTENGDGAYTMADGEVWLYPARGFEGSGAVLRRRVRCLSAEVQVLCHAGYELDDDDLHDLRALRERFGVG